MITLETLTFLKSELGGQWLKKLAKSPPTPHNHLQWATRLRKVLSPENASALLETALLRERATTKFSRANHMFFTRAALEQASGELVSRYRVGRFENAGISRIADFCCSIGGDALTFAEKMEVVGVDIDPVRLALAQENVTVYGQRERFSGLEADVMAVATTSDYQAIFCDPARRTTDGKRIFSLHHYLPPPLLIWQRWQPFIKGMGIKISPGVDYDELPKNAGIEFISVNGDVKEGVLWLGGLHDGVARRATLLPGGETLTSEEMPAIPIPILPPQQYLYEPDGAVIRAHLVEALAMLINAGKIHPDIAYFTTNQPIQTPFARGFIIQDHFPFQLKRLKQYIRAHKIGQVTVKKRGSPLDPDWLRHQLPLKGKATAHIFLTQVTDTPTVLIAQPL